MLTSRVLTAHVVDGATAFTFWGEVAATHELLGAVQVILVDSSFHDVFRQHLARCYSVRVEKPTRVLVRKINFCIHT